MRLNAMCRGVTSDEGLAHCVQRRQGEGSTGTQIQVKDPPYPRRAPLPPNYRRDPCWAPAGGGTLGSKRLRGAAGSLCHLPLGYATANAHGC